MFLVEVSVIINLRLLVLVLIDLEYLFIFILYIFLIQKIDKGGELFGLFDEKDVFKVQWKRV